MTPPLVSRFQLPFPPSLNGLFDGGHKTKRRFKSDEYQAWIIHAGWKLAAQKSIIRAHKGKVRATYQLTPPDNHRRDLDNFSKALGDFLVLHQVIADDSLIEELHLKWDRNAPESGAIVIVEDL